MPSLRPLWLALWVLLWAGAVPAQEIVVTFGGDVNFARSRERPLADRVRKNGTHTLHSLTETLAEEWTGRKCGDWHPPPCGAALGILAAQ